MTPAAPSPLILLLLSLAGAGLPAGSPSPQGPHEVGRSASPTVMVRSGAVGVLLADSGSPSFPPGDASPGGLTRGEAVVSPEGFCHLQGVSGSWARGRCGGWRGRVEALGLSCCGRGHKRTKARKR